jgi:hypothetical protein
LEKGRQADRLREHLAGVARNLFNKVQSERWRQERQWYMNLSFYYGQHHFVWRNARGAPRGTFDLHLPEAPYWRVRPVINQVRKVCRRDMSRLTSQKPNAFIMPASSEDRDIFAAQAGEAIWDSLWRRLAFKQIMREIAFWQVVCGNGFSKQWWNSSKQDPTNPGKFGDVQIDPITPFHIYVPDLKETKLQSQPYLFHAKTVTKEYVKNTFGVDAASKAHSIVDSNMLSVMGINNKPDKEDTTIILEMWVNAGVLKEFPDGGMLTVADDKVVQGQVGHVYNHGEYPYSKFDGIPTGKFYNESILVDLIPLQRELNRTRGQIIEAKNIMSKPQIAAERGSLDAHRITSEPGLVIFYKPGYNPPKPMPLQNLPSYVTEEVNRIYTDIADLSGQHEVSEGKTPPGVTAAVAISYLQEQDESLISSYFDSEEEGIQDIARQCLSYVKDYWDEPRTVQTVGMDRTFDVQTFLGSDLRSNTDIRVEAGSMLPKSRAAKQAFIMDLMNSGFIPPEKGLEILELGGVEKLYEEIQVDQRQIQRENLKMRVVKPEDVMAHIEAWNQKPLEERSDPITKQPLPPPLIIPVNNYDNHLLHIEGHNRYRKTQAYEMADTLVKRLFDEHVQNHKDALVAPENLNAPAQLGQPLGSPVPSTAGPGPESGLDPSQVQPNGSGPASVGSGDVTQGGM